MQFLPGYVLSGHGGEQHGRDAVDDPPSDGSVGLELRARKVRAMPASAGKASACSGRAERQDRVVGKVRGHATCTHRPLLARNLLRRVVLRAAPRTATKSSRGPFE